MGTRGPVVLLVSISLAAGGIGFTAAPAEACTLTVHCYGGISMTQTSVDGVYSQVQPLCLAVPINNFATDEVWLTDASHSHWVEVGFIERCS